MFKCHHCRFMKPWVTGSWGPALCVCCAAVHGWAYRMKDRMIDLMNFLDESYERSYMASETSLAHSSQEDHPLWEDFKKLWNEERDGDDNTLVEGRSLAWRYYVAGAENGARPGDRAHDDYF